MRHAIKTGLFPKSTEYWNSKLSEFDIKQIVEMNKNGTKGYVIANHFAVSKSTVSEILSGKRHKSLTGSELVLKQ